MRSTRSTYDAIPRRDYDDLPPEAGSDYDEPDLSTATTTFGQPRVSDETVATVAPAFTGIPTAQAQSYRIKVSYLDDYRQAQQLGTLPANASEDDVIRRWGPELVRDRPVTFRLLLVDLHGAAAQEHREFTVHPSHQILREVRASSGGASGGGASAGFMGIDPNLFTVLKQVLVDPILEQTRRREEEIARREAAIEADRRAVSEAKHATTDLVTSSVIANADKMLSQSQEVNSRGVDALMSAAQRQQEALVSSMDAYTQRMQLQAEMQIKTIQAQAEAERQRMQLELEQARLKVEADDRRRREEAKREEERLRAQIEADDRRRQEAYEREEARRLEYRNQMELIEERRRAEDAERRERDEERRLRAEREEREYRKQRDELLLQRAERTDNPLGSVIAIAAGVKQIADSVGLDIGGVLPALVGGAKSSTIAEIVKEGLVTFREVIKAGAGADDDDDDDDDEEAAAAPPQPAPPRRYKPDDTVQVKMQDGTVRTMKFRDYQALEAQLRQQTAQPTQAQPAALPGPVAGDPAALQGAQVQAQPQPQVAYRSYGDIPPAPADQSSPPPQPQPQQAPQSAPPRPPSPPGTVVTIRKKINEVVSALETRPESEWQTIIMAAVSTTPGAIDYLRSVSVERAFRDSGLSEPVLARALAMLEASPVVTGSGIPIRMAK